MRIKIAIAILLLAASAASAQFSKSTISGQITTQFPDQTTGQITPATTRTFLNNLLNSYQQYAGLNKQVGTTYTIQTSDYGQLVTFANPLTVSVTLSPGNSSGYSTFNFYAQNISLGNVVIAPIAGTICGASTLTLANTQSAWIISDGTNYQCVFGLAGTQLTTPLSVAQGGTAVTQSNFTGFDNVSGLTTLGFVLRNAAASYTTLNQLNGLTLGNLAQTTGTTTLCNPSNTNQNWIACNPGSMSLVLCTPTRINFTTATNSTFTTPLCNGAFPTQIEVEMVGGGGSGAGSGSPGAASFAGTASCWKTSGTACSSADFQAGGGGAGSTSSAAPVANGGTATNCDIGIGGGNGGMVSTTAQQFGSAGGNGFFGGGGPGGTISGGVVENGMDAIDGTGGGGGGASAAATANTGGGGGAGAYCLKTLTPANIVSSYVVTVGTGGKAGTAGTAGAAGGKGGNGFITIKARWQ